MGTDISFTFVHTMTVEPFLGTDANGAEVYGPAATLACFRDYKRRRVLDAGGETVVSESTLYAAPTAAAAYPPGSRVTHPTSGVVSYVIAGNTLDMPGFPTPDHSALSLT